MSEYSITIHVRTGDPGRIQPAIENIFRERGFELADVQPLSSVVADETLLPEDEDWYGLVIGGPIGRGWVAVDVEDWADSGILAKGISAALGVPTIEVWVSEETRWGYTYYEAGRVVDRFTNSPREIAQSPDEIALLGGDPWKMASVIGVGADTLRRGLDKAQTEPDQFPGIGINILASAIGLPWENTMTGYDQFFDEDPEDYAKDIAGWPDTFRHLIFRHPKKRDRLAE